MEPRSFKKATRRSPNFRSCLPPCAEGGGFENREEDAKKARRGEFQKKMIYLTERRESKTGRRTLWGSEDIF